jgi:exodeoxyribonuclease VII large subunit
MTSATADQSSVYTVSQLSAQIKKLLESSFRFIWVKGEISNFRAPASGHHYFTLKDEHSQIRAVMFRAQQRSLRFVPEDGLQVLCQGRISVYEPRGEYQLIIDVMEPRGAGLLQLAFEQLKKKLEAEGLFDPAQKRPLPSCPQRIGIVTSATGAAIHDILKVLQRSPYPLTVTLIPVRVQGQGAATEIAAAIDAANDVSAAFAWDVLLVGRGGGSLEDLWPFNEEAVARAMARSQIPVISAVGHEIDLTIADLAADLRAPTPTAAAEWIVAQLQHLQTGLAEQQKRLLHVVRLRLDAHRQVLHFYEKRLQDPRKRLGDLRLLVDDRLTRLQLAFARKLENWRAGGLQLQQKLNFYNPLARIHRYRELIEQHARELASQQRHILDGHRSRLQGALVALENLSPLSTLARGYSITYRLPDLKIVHHEAQVRLGQKVRVQLAKGALECLVESKQPEAPPSPQELDDGDSKKT